MKKFKELNSIIESLETRPNSKRMKEITDLRLEAVKALSDSLKKESEAEHEKSHLLESYGALILALEGEFKKLQSRS